jgi:hypothetical protein
MYRATVDWATSKPSLSTHHEYAARATGRSHGSTVTVREAPITCGVIPGKNITRPTFSIRAFDNRLWWPLFDGLRPMSVGDHVTSATQSEGPFLAMMNLSPATVRSKPRRNAQQFFEQIFARKVDGPSEEELWRSPRRIAHRTLFCDDQVYVEGGRPVYFGVRRGNDLTLSMEVGSADAEQVNLVSKHLPCPRPSERREAASQLLVFGAENIEDDVDLLRRRGFSVTFGSTAEVDAELRSHRDACEVFADAIVRKAVATMGPRLFEGLEKMLQRKLQAAARLPRHIPSEICRDVIHAITAACPEDAFLGRFGVEFECAAEALTRLEAMHRHIFSELDEQALISLGDLAAIT